MRAEIPPSRYDSTGTARSGAVQLFNAALEKPCVVFSKEACTWCKRAELMLSMHGAKCSKVELDALGPAAGEVAQLLVDATGQNTVPNIIVAGRHVGGYAELRDLYDRCAAGDAAVPAEVCKILGAETPAQAQGARRGGLNLFAH